MTLLDAPPLPSADDLDRIVAAADRQAARLQIQVRAARVEAQVRAAALQPRLIDAGTYDAAAPPPVITSAAA